MHQTRKTFCDLPSRMRQSFHEYEYFGAYVRYCYLFIFEMRQMSYSKLYWEKKEQFLMSFHTPNEYRNELNQFHGYPLHKKSDLSVLMPKLCGQKHSRIPLKWWIQRIQLKMWNPEYNYKVAVEKANFIRVTSFR